MKYQASELELGNASCLPTERRVKRHASERDDSRTTRHCLREECENLMVESLSLQGSNFLIVWGGGLEDVWEVKGR